MNGALSANLFSLNNTATTDIDSDSASRFLEGFANGDDSGSQQDTEELQQFKSIWAIDLS